MNSAHPQIDPASGPSDPPDEDETVAALRSTLFREAERVMPSPDGLQRIQREIRAGRARRPGGAWVGRLTPALTAAAAVVVLAVAGAVAVRLGQPGSGESPVQPAATTSATPEAPAGKLPVYVIGEQGGRRWLFREYRTTHATTADDKVAEAITDAVNLAATDPDYGVRLFQGGNPGQATATVSPSLITVTLTAAMVSRPGMDEADAELAAQQLVWTATATAGTGYARTPVKITVGQGAQSLFGVLPLNRTFTRATGSADPRAPIWIISLAEGTDVGHRPFRAQGDARVGTGGSVSWTLERDGGEVGGGEARLTERIGTRTGWECAPQTLQPGTYVLRVTVRPGNGTGLSRTTEYQDSRTFYVR
jgi:hypothetical protein